MSVMRFCLCAFLCGASAVVWADEDGLGSAMTMEQLRQQSTVQHEKRAPVLLVSPADEPSPALKYRFHPPIWEKHPSTAMLHYMRANASLLDRVQGSWQLYETEAWQEKNHSDGPSPEQLAEAVRGLDSVFGHIRELALAEENSWDHRIRDLRGPDVYAYLLPDVQQARRFARLLTLRVRDQLNRNDIGGAVTSARDGLRLAEFVGNGEFLIQQLVAIAIASITSEQINEMIQHPECPNLYWALATLPRPLVSMTDSLQWEYYAIHQVLPMLQEAETEVWTEKEALVAWSAMIDSLKVVGALTDGDFGRSAVSLTAMGVTQGESARRRLRSRGFTGDRLRQMSNVQCVLADASVEITTMGNELAKTLLLPDNVSEKLRQQAEADYREWSTQVPPTVGSLIGQQLMPVAMQAKEAERRVHMRFNRLMTLEAIRMHVAEHDGELPETLDDLSPVPAMPDPYTGRHFDYRIESDGGAQVVVLEAAGPTSYLLLKELRFRFRSSAE